MLESLIKPVLHYSRIFVIDIQYVEKPLYGLTPSVQLYKSKGKAVKHRYTHGCPLLVLIVQRADECCVATQSLFFTKRHPLGDLYVWKQQSDLKCQRTPQAPQLIIQTSAAYYYFSHPCNISAWALIHCSDNKVLCCNLAAFASTCTNAKLQQMIGRDFHWRLYLRI